MAATTVHATQITIGASRDSTIYKSQPNNSNSQGVGMFVGQDPGGASTSKRALIGFDVAGNVPAGSTIQSVVLGLTFGQAAGSGGTLGNGDQTPRQVDVLRMTANWSEGTSGTGNTAINGSGQGFAASAGDPTWNNRVNPSTPWTTAGGDFTSTISASTVVGNPNTNLVYDWGSTANMVADVQLWLNNPLLNSGWILKEDDETTTQSFRAFYTSNATNLSFRPTLTITFVPEPATLLTFGLGALGFVAFVRRVRKSAPIC